MLTIEIKEIKSKGDDKEKAILEKILNTKDELVDEVSSLHDLQEINLKDKTTKINTELDKLKSNITKIVNAFSPIKKDLFKKSNVLYVLMKRVEAVEKQVHLEPTLAFDHVSMVEGQT